MCLNFLIIANRKITTDEVSFGYILHVTNLSKFKVQNEGIFSLLITKTFSSKIQTSRKVKIVLHRIPVKIPISIFLGFLDRWRQFFIRCRAFRVTRNSFCFLKLIYVAVVEVACLGKHSKTLNFVLNISSKW